MYRLLISFVLLTPQYVDEDVHVHIRSVDCRWFFICMLQHGFVQANVVVLSNTVLWNLKICVSC